MPAYQAELPKFAGYDAQVVGISTDSIFCHMAWQEKEIGKLDYPLLSDFWPHGATAKKYEILREGAPLPGISERAIFIVDKEGKIAFSKVYELGEQPPHEDIYAVLKSLK